MELEDDHEYIKFLTEMKKFNEMSEKLFRMRIVNNAYLHAKVWSFDVNTIL